MSPRVALFIIGLTVVLTMGWAPLSHAETVVLSDLCPIAVAVVGEAPTC